MNINFFVSKKRHELIFFTAVNFKFVASLITRKRLVSISETGYLEKLWYPTFLESFLLCRDQVR